ncbi:Phage-related minor tail protein [Citrobacter koseri]|nr:Phage-related minor tail protein [Citrobacter koseri]
MTPDSFSILTPAPGDLPVEEPDDDMLMAKASGMSGGVRYGPDGSGDLVVNLDVNSSKFNEQITHVNRQLKKTGDAANDSALRIQQSFTRQEAAARKAGISVGQYNAAMRMLPAQFTDIATQLAGGQSPWLILLQQGGQVKDSFGGIIPTFRALLGAVSPLMVGVGALSAATGALFYAWYQGSSTLSDFNKTLALSGNSAGLTADRMLVLARNGQSAGLTFNQTSEALTELINAGVRVGANFDDMSQAVARFTQASGVPVDKVAAAFGKLTSDPTSGLIAMAQQFHNVTAEQIAYVAQLQRAGDEAAALQAANDAATNGFNEQTKSLRDNMGTIESAADSLKRAFKSMWDAALDIGRPDTAQEMVRKAEAAFKRADEIWNLRKMTATLMMRRAPGTGLTGRQPGWRWTWRNSRRALQKRMRKMLPVKLLRNLIGRNTPRRRSQITPERSPRLRSTRPGKTSLIRR